MRFRMVATASSCLLIALAVVGQNVDQTGTLDALQRDFLNPPAAARPRVWWHWMNGNVTQEGIKLDLEWMNRVGIGGLQNFDAALATPTVVDKRLAYMTPEWKEAFRYAVEMADKLGLEMAIASSPGWSETGGPWVKPAEAMKKLVWTETRVAGGKEFTGTLPKPSSVTGPFQAVSHREDIPLPGSEPKALPQYYGDAAVVAYQLPGAGATDDAQPTITSSGGSVDASLLNDGDLAKSVRVPVDRGADGGWLRYEYPTPLTLYAVTLSRPIVGLFMPAPPFRYRFESSDDGQAFQAVADFPFTRVAQETVSFRPVTARHFRLKIEKAPPSAPMGPFEPAPGVDIGSLWRTHGRRHSK